MSNSDTLHPTRDCISNLEFIYNTNGGYDHHQARQTTPTGDCVVIATSITTGICYAEAQRRLSLLAESLSKYSDKLGVPEDINSKNPMAGTHLITCRLFLITHCFSKLGTNQCICDAEAPHIVIGNTDNGQPHAAAVQNGYACGTHDITANPFEVLEVWKLDRQTFERIKQVIPEAFNSRKAVNARVRQLLLTSDSD
jgi:hypothetical protein